MSHGERNERSLAILRAPSISHHEMFLYCTTQIARLFCGASTNCTRSAIYPRHLSLLTPCGQGSFHNWRLQGIAWLSVTPENETVWSKREQRESVHMQRSPRQTALTWTLNSWAIYTVFTHSCLYGNVLHVFVGFLCADVMRMCEH